jgi:hypothetical protein
MLAWARDLLGAVVGGRTVCRYVESGCEVAYYAQINNPTDGYVNVTVSGQYVDYE